MVFFAPDLDDYIAARDFYVDYKEFVPGPISRTTDELINDIRDNAFDESVLNGFLSNYFDDLDGKSSKRLVDALENGFNNLK